MEVEDAEREGVEDGFWDDATVGGKDAKIGLEIFDELEGFGGVFWVEDWDIFLFGAFGDRERFAGVGISQKEGEELAIIVFEKSVKEESLCLDTLGKLFVAEKNDF